MVPALRSLRFHLGSVTQARCLAVFNNAEAWPRWEPLAAPASLADLYNLISLMGHAVQDLFPTDQRENKQGNIPSGFLPLPPRVLLPLEVSPLISPHRPPRLKGSRAAPTPGGGSIRTAPQPVQARDCRWLRTGADTAATRGCGGVPASPR